jgi:hypothetical protein
MSFSQLQFTLSFSLEQTLIKNKYILFEWNFTFKMAIGSIIVYSSTRSKNQCIKHSLIKILKHYLNGQVIEPIVCKTTFFFTSVKIEQAKRYRGKYCFIPGKQKDLVKHKKHNPSI